MAQPQAYNREVDFTERDGDDTNHAGINAELDAAALSINQIRDNLALIQRDDGGLQNGIVTADSLAPSAFDAVLANVNEATQEAQTAANQATLAASTAIAARNDAQTAETSAETAAAAALLNANTATTKAAEALSSATSAASSASTATTKASEASTSATNAATSATAAAGSATSAGTSATNAAASAATATTKAAEASASATSASASASSALASLNEFKGRYYGPLATDPTLDPLGNAPTAGDLYFNTGTNRLRVFNATTSTWNEGNAGSVAVQNFSGNGSQTVFTLAAAPESENNTQVYISGVYQQKDQYSISGTTLTFSSAPPAGTNNIEVVTLNTLPLGVTSDDLVQTAPEPGGLWSTVRGFITWMKGRWDALTSSIGSSLVGFIQSGTGAVQRTAQSKLREVVSVKDFGAVGDGVTDDTAAIQAAFNWVASAEALTIGTWMTVVGHVHFPQGIYKITGAITVRGFVVISGVGTGYVAGTTIRQHATDTHIFVFQGLTRDLGTCVRDINFEFATNAGSKSGYALYYPYESDVEPGLVLSSNSHYIRNCRFGGWYRYGRFLFLAACNDVEISGNVIDVCLDANPSIQIGSQSLAGGCSDVRIVGNNFFMCDLGIFIANATAVTITGNNFSNQQNLANRAAIRLSTDTGTENAGKINGVTIVGNSFWAQYTCLWFSGSATNVVYSDNIHKDCLNYPLAGNGATSFYRYKITNNIFHLANGFSAAVSGTYPNTQAPLVFFGAQMFDSEICDNSVDANGLNAVIAFLNDQASTGWLSTGMTLRNNIIKNNTSYPGAFYCFVPTTAKELVIESKRVFNAYPTNEPVFNFSTNGFQIADSVTFDVDYEVVCDRAGVDIGVSTGRVRVSVVRYAASGPAATKSNITVISSVGDNYNGGGGGVIPAVTFSMVVSPNPYLVVTVTSTLGTPIVTTVKCKALNFRASGVAQIRSS